MTQQAPTKTSDGALDDLLVLELGDEATQYCGQLLADLGARVIKIEPPQGAAARHRGPFKDDRPDINGSLYFWANNTSKESITLRLDDEADWNKLQRLAAKADIVLEDFRPGHLDSIGLGYEQLSAANPRLIMTSVTSFGQTGPLKDWKGGDLVHWATGGILTGGYADDPSTPPLLAQGELSFITAGHWAMIGTLLALAARDVSGEGQHVDISIQEACTYVNRGVVTEKGFVVAPGESGPIRRGSFAESRIQCKDGIWFLPWSLNMRAERWDQLVELFKREDIGQGLWNLDFPGLVARAPQEARPLEDPEVRAAIIELASRKTAEEISTIGMDLGMTWAVFHAPDELFDDEQLKFRGFFQQIHHPEHDAHYTYAGPPFTFTAAGWKIRRRPPLLGEDNDKLSALLDGAAR